MTPAVRALAGAEAAPAVPLSTTVQGVTVAAVIAAVTVADAVVVAEGEGTNLESVIFAVLALQSAALLLLFGTGYRALSRVAVKLIAIADVAAVVSFYLLQATAGSWIPISGKVSADLAELSALFVAVVVALVGTAVLLLRAAWAQRAVPRSERRSSTLVTIGGTLGFYGVLVLTGIFRAVTLPDINSMSSSGLVHELLSETIPARRMEALVTLQERGAEQTVPAIIAQLEHTQTPVQSEGIPPLLRLLGESGREEAIPTLRIWLQKDVSPLAWAQAAWSLARLGYREVAKSVEERLRSSDPAWFQVTPQLLEILAFLDAEESVPTIAAQLQGASGLKGDLAESVVQNSLLALIAINSAESTAALQAYVGDDESRKRQVETILEQIRRSVAG